MSAANSLSTLGFSTRVMLLRGVSCVREERPVVTEWLAPVAIDPPRVAQLPLPVVLTVGVAVPVMYSSGIGIQFVDL